MAKPDVITATGVFLRFVFACVLVFASYNPHGHSFYHLLVRYPEQALPLPLLAFLGVVLLIGWVIYLRAVSRSLGFIGIILAIAFFSTLVWLGVYYGIIAASTPVALAYIIELIICAVLAVGISWSHIRRRITGQVDTDDLETG